MKPEIDYIITAEKVILDQEGGKPTIIGVFQEINIPQEMEAVSVFVTVFARVLKLRDEVRAKVTIRKPDGDELSVVEMKGTVEGEGAANIRGIFNILSFSDAGIYNIEININGQDLVTKEQHVIKVNKL